MSHDELPDGWVQVSRERTLPFESELQREVCADHVLSDTTVRCLARRDGWDDFLFSLESHASPLAVVHLTWAAESEPDFPRTTFFDSPTDFASNWRRIFE